MIKNAWCDDVARIQRRYLAYERCVDLIRLTEEHTGANAAHVVCDCPDKNALSVQILCGKSAT